MILFIICVVSDYRKFRCKNRGRGGGHAQSFKLGIHPSPPISNTINTEGDPIYIAMPGEITLKSKLGSAVL